MSDYSFNVQSPSHDVRSAPWHNVRVPIKQIPNVPLHNFRIFRYTNKCPTTPSNNVQSPSNKVRMRHGRMSEYPLHIIRMCHYIRTINCMNQANASYTTDGSVIMYCPKSSLHIVQITYHIMPKCTIACCLNTPLHNERMCHNTMSECLMT